MKQFLLSLAFLPTLLFAQSDLSLDSAFHRSGVGGFFESGLEYFHFGTDQRPLVNFSGIISNSGATDLSNCSLLVNVNYEGSTIFSGSSNPIDLLIGESDSVEIVASFDLDGADYGKYEFDYWVEFDGLDDSPSNDSYQDSLFVSESDWGQENRYSRSNRVLTEVVNQAPLNEGEFLTIGSVYEAFDDLCVAGIDVFIADSISNIGQEIYGEVALFNTTDGEWVHIGTTPEHIISDGDLGKFVYLFAEAGFSFKAGDIFMVGAGHYGGPNPPYFGLSQKTDSNTVIQLSLSGFEPLFISKVPMINPGLYYYTDCWIGIAEEDLTVGTSNHPNPFNSSTTISFQLPNPESVGLRVTDIHGKEIYSEDLGVMGVGENQHQLFTEDWPEGVYLYTISAGGIQETKRMILIR